MHEYLHARCSVNDDELGSEELLLFEAIVGVFFSIIELYFTGCAAPSVIF